MHQRNIILSSWWTTFALFRTVQEQFLLPHYLDDLHNLQRVQTACQVEILMWHPLQTYHIVHRYCIRFLILSDDKSKKMTLPSD
jgi:hypothetical protein